MMRNQLQKQIQQFITPFIQLSSLSNMQCPILPTTYTLWRKVCYKNMRQKYKYEPEGQQQKQLKRAFFQVSERKLLPIFIDKVKSEIDGRSVGWRKAIMEEDQLKKVNSQEYRQLLLEYSELLYIQELYIQMFYDLVSIPYTEIYDQNKTFQTNDKFKANIYKKRNQTLIDKACHKLGKNIISKGLGKISEVALSKWMVYGMSGIISSFNPLALAASFSISYAMQSHEKYSKIKQITSQIQYIKAQIQKNIKQLQQTYDRCLCSLQAMFFLQQSQKEVLAKLKRKFSRENLESVLVQDWLQIKITKTGEWEVVQLKNKYQDDSFSDIQLIQFDTKIQGSK